MENSKHINPIETTVVIKNQNSLDKPLLTLILRGSLKMIPEFPIGSSILEFLENHINECKLSETEPNGQLELVFTKRIPISLEDFFYLKDLHLNGALYSELEELFLDHNINPEKQKEILQKYISSL